MRDVLFHFMVKAAALSLLLVAGQACMRDTETPVVSVPANSSSSIIFTEVTETAGLGGFRHDNGAAGKKYYPEMMGSGGGFIDYDGDGWLDILLMGGGRWDEPMRAGYRPLALFANNEDGTFTDRTAEAGLDIEGAFTIGLTVADYDNDGDEDFYLTNLRENMLFRNDGGVFTNVTKEAGLGMRDEWSSSALFFDATLDGNLDLFVGNYVDWSIETDKFCPEGGRIKLYCIPANYEGIDNAFFLNNGDGTFVDRTKEAGFSQTLGKTLGIVEIDYNEDGWPDLAVANDGEGDLLYMNNGDGTFSERGARAGFAFSEHGEARAGMGIDAGVIDSTGQLVLFVGNFSEEMIGVYRHTGDGFFVDQAATSRIGHPSLLTLTFGLFLFDVDLDTDLDLFAANGHVYPDRLAEQDKITFQQRAQLYLNRGDGIFDEYLPATGPLSHVMVARGAAYADYDRDGDLDVLITENDGPAHLWRNDLEGGRFLRVSLEGRQSNRSALGTWVQVLAGGLRMERRMRTGSSYLSQSEKTQVFGLGANETADSVVVFWPSGRIDRFGRVGANKEIRIVEGAGGYEALPVPAAAVSE